MCGSIGGTFTFRLFTCKEFRTLGPQPIFSVPRGAFNFNFRIRRNAYFSRHNFRPPQQLGISFIDCGISFARIADFFYILYLSLKNCKFTASTLSILHYLSSKTYPPEPILQNLSSRTYLPIDFV